MCMQYIVPTYLPHLPRMYIPMEVFRDLLESERK